MEEEDKNPLAGALVAISGRLSKSKEEYAKEIAAHGGTFSNTVTKKVTILVAGDPDAASDKLVKARQNGTRIVSEQWLTAAALGAPAGSCSVGIAENAREASTEQHTKMVSPPAVLLAESFNADKHNAVGMWWSEKLDGVRAWWDGNNFWSRQGNLFYAPAWFKEHFPRDVVLDGELFMGRNQFQATISVVRSQSKSDAWRQICFQVFDIPSSGALPFEARLELMRQLPQNEYLRVVEQTLVEPGDNIEHMLRELEALGAEGLMLRAPHSKYVGKRSKTLLKVKSFTDDEARVTAYATEGKGRLAGMTSSLHVVGRDGTTFKVGSGLNDEQRRNPPPIGSIITYKYQEKTKDGKPRFPTFVGMAIDKDFP